MALPVKFAPFLDNYQLFAEKLEEKFASIADFDTMQLALGNSVTAARLTLDQLVEVRILVPQFPFPPR